MKKRSRSPFEIALEAPDLPTQLEQLLDHVWNLEAEWRLDDRIELALRCRPPARKGWAKS